MILGNKIKDKLKNNNSAVGVIGTVQELVFPTILCIQLTHTQNIHIMHTWDMIPLCSVMFPKKFGMPGDVWDGNHFGKPIFNGEYGMIFCNRNHGPP